MDEFKIELDDFLAKLKAGEVSSFVMAYIHSNGIVSTINIGGVLTQCGLLAFLEREVTSKIEV